MAQGHASRLSTTYLGTAEATFELATTDTATAFVAAKYRNTTTNKVAKYCLVQVLDNTVKFCFGNATPVAGASSGLGIEVADGGTLEIFGVDNISKVKYISAVGAAAARLEVTMFF